MPSPASATGWRRARDGGVSRIREDGQVFFEKSRWIDIYEDRLDEEQLKTWVRQAAALPGCDLT